jgi:hypothetical protein
MDGSNMNMLRDGASASADAEVMQIAQPQRRATVVASRLPDRLPARVLQTGRAPAQLSLFLRPGSSSR